jgi:hypothetical protein
VKRRVGQYFRVGPDRAHELCAQPAGSLKCPLSSASDQHDRQRVTGQQSFHVPGDAFGELHQLALHHSGGCRRTPVHWQY